MKTTKKIVALFLAVLMAMSMFSVSMTAFAATKKPVTKITLSKTKATIYTNEKLTLTAKITPSNATNKKVTWSTSNKNVATVSSKGVVTPKKAGTATITVKAADGSKKSATCKVTVKKFVKITSMKMNVTSKTINTGSTYKLKVTASPSNATVLTYKWKSSDTKIATVSSTGVVTAKKAGKATITATATDGSGKKVSAKITVKDVPVSAIKLSKTKATIYPGDTLTLKATVSPTNATNPAVKWTSSNTKAATVSSKGVVRGVKAGETATITATAADGSGKKATCKITVGVRASVIAVTSEVDTNSSWYKGKKGTLEASFEPDNTTNKKVTWTSSDAKTVSVDANGNVEVLKAAPVIGTKTVTITATAADGSGVKGTYKITLTAFKAVKSLSIAEDFPTEFFAGQKEKLPVKINPTDASERGLIYKSDKPEYVTVDASGKVTALKETPKDTVVTITATSVNDSTKSVSAKIKVVPVEMMVSIYPTPSEDYYVIGQNGVELFAWTNPSKALSAIGTRFESENSDIAIARPVTDNPNRGNVELRSAGKTRIRVVAASGTVASDWVEIEVRELRTDKGYFDNLTVGSAVELSFFAFNGEKLEVGAVDPVWTAANSEYFDAVPNEDDPSKMTIIVKKALPAGGVYVTFQDAATSTLKTTVLFASEPAKAAPTGTKTQLLKAFKAYSASAQKMNKATMIKDVSYDNIVVDNKKSKSSMTVNGMSIDFFIKLFGRIAGDDVDELMSEMSPEAMINSIFDGSTEDKDTVNAESFPAAITVDEADVSKIEVIDSGAATYQMKLTLKDQTTAVALDAVKTSAYGKTMNVVDRKFIDEYSKTLSSVGGDELGADSKINLKLGPVNQKYTGGYVVYTINRLTDKVVDAEYHYNSDIKVDNADFTMNASLSDDSDSFSLGVRIIGYFTMKVDSTTRYTSMTY